MTVEAPTPSTQVGFTRLCQITYPEVAGAKKAVCTLDGYLVGGPDRRGGNAIQPAKLWHHWQTDVAQGFARGIVPAKVQDYFEKTKHLTSPPRGLDLQVYGSNPSSPRVAELDAEALRARAMLDAVSEIQVPTYGTTQEDTLLDLGTTPPAAVAPKKKLANPPRFATSYSGMKDFLNCPAKWAAAKYFKTLPYIEGPEAAWGNRVHKALENVLCNVLIADDIKIIKENGYERFLKAIFAARKAGATIEVEKELCFTKELKPCGWKDWNTVWFRFKGDVHIIRGAKFNYIDWKTGKRYSKGGADQADLFQLEVAWAVVALHRPEIKEFTGKLIYLKETDLAKAVVGISLTRADLPRIWEKISAITGRMEEAWATENFRMQTSGLCKNSCGNKECPHCG